MKITCKAKDQTLESILGGICDKHEFGYLIISKSNDRYDGWILLRKAKEKERGYEAGKEPKKEKF